MTISAIGLAFSLWTSVIVTSSHVVKIFVYAHINEDRGFVPLDAASTLDSVHDLQHQLTGRKGRLVLVAASDRRLADVLIEVLGREQLSDDSDKRTVHVRLIVKDYSLPIDGRDDDGSWRDAARDAAKQIIRWMDLNADRLTLSLENRTEPAAEGRGGALLLVPEF